MAVGGPWGRLSTDQPAAVPTCQGGEGPPKAPIAFSEKL